MYFKFRRIGCNSFFCFWISFNYCNWTYFFICNIKISMRVSWIFWFISTFINWFISNFNFNYSIFIFNFRISFIIYIFRKWWITIFPIIRYTNYLYLNIVVFFILSCFPSWIIRILFCFLSSLIVISLGLFISSCFPSQYFSFTSIVGNSIYF